MREIKFRFWDSKEKNMYIDSPSFAIGCDGQVSQLIYNDTDTNDYVEWEGTYYSKYIKPLQYTGLKDKNGKEIYEGDIIQFVWDTDSCWGKAGIYRGYIRFNEGVFEVVYIDREKITKYPDGGWHENSESDDIQSFFSWSEEIEIIGNVYENKELLEVK